MNPPPHPQPPQVVVVQKSGCGKAAIIIVCILAVIGVIIGGCTVLGLAGVGKALNDAEVRKNEQAALASSLEIVDFQWNKEAGFGAVMEASFKIRNNGSVDMKDIEIECTHYAPSGTKIDSNKRTIFEIVKAGETREFPNFNMGFIDSQVDKSVPLITKAVPIK